VIFRQFHSDTPPDTLLEEPGTLAVITFGSKCEPGKKLGITPIGLESLSGNCSEVIQYGEKPVNRGINGRVHWSQTNDVLFTAIWLDQDACGDMQQEVYQAYLDLFEMLHEAGYNTPFRMWNFIPKINEEDRDLEIYKQFCSGRHDAFCKLGITADEFPSASALGHHTQGAVIYALASTNDAIHFENPFQTSAYKYPKQYGPRSPSFARASSIELASEKHIFVSGTSSILGYETRAAGLLHDQLTITVDNIKRLLLSITDDVKKLTTVRVYLRHAADLASAKSLIGEAYKDIDTHYLLADICRSDLLVEVEVTSKLITQ